MIAYPFALDAICFRCSAKWDGWALCKLPRSYGEQDRWSFGYLCRGCDEKEQSAREAQKGTIMDETQQQAALKQVAERGYTIAERIVDHGLAVRELRDALKQTITAVADVAVPARQEDAKRRHVAELRALLANVDRVIAVIDEVAP